MGGKLAVGEAADGSGPSGGWITQQMAALLTKLSGMIQEDQATSLRLLDQSITVTEHFANKASETPNR